MTETINFDDGAAYERYMGLWSQRAGDAFLDWLSPAPALRWLDVGCGNGAFTARIVDRCAPASVDGVDPADGQLAYARQRADARVAHFRQGDAMALPYADAVFDIAVMPLVIFFVPEPAVGVREMARVVRRGGLVTAYAWDMPGGGFPYATLQAEMRRLGVVVPQAPRAEVSKAGHLLELWAGAGLRAIETREIVVERTFPDFDAYWATVQGGPSVTRGLAAMSPSELAVLKARMREHLVPDASGRITSSARANAIRGEVGLAQELRPSPAGAAVP